jgi:hypothetical protein
MNVKRGLILSVTLNIILQGGLLWAVNSRKNHAIPDVSPVKGETTAVAEVKPIEASLPVPTPSATDTEKSAKSIDWHMVESEDYKKYIANLRSIGCPEETIKDIIAADVNKLFASRKRALSVSTNKFQYWKSGNMFASMMDEEKIKQSQELSKEKRALLTELLGAAPEEKPDLLGGMNPFESLLDFLSPAKQTDVAEIYQKYQAKMMKGLGNGSPDAEDMKKIQGTQREMEAELAKTLTPEEYQAYQLRMSSTAMSMRMQLTSMDPSEQEFLDIFKVKKGLDDQFGVYGMAGLSKEDKDKYATAKKEADAQIKTILGDDRYKDYERAQDFAYQGIYKTADRNGLGKEVANQVYDMKTAAEEQVKALSQDQSLSAENRKQSLANIRTETENSIKNVFGEKAWTSYQNQPGAYWLKNISPDPKTP